jgi:hypothetical protein
MTPAGGISLDTGRFGRVYHRRAGDVDILHDVVGGFSQRADGEPVAADTGYVGYCDAVCAGLEGDAVVVVGYFDVVDEDVCAGADVEAVGVFGEVGALGGCVHCEGCKGDVVGAAFYGVEDVGWVLLPEVGDCYVGAAGYLEEKRKISWYKCV